MTMRKTHGSMLPPMAKEIEPFVRSMNKLGIAVDWAADGCASPEVMPPSCNSLRIIRVKIDDFFCAEEAGTNHSYR